MTPALVEGEPISADLVRLVTALEQELEVQTVLREAADRKLQSGRQDHEDDFERLLLRCRQLEADIVRLTDDSKAQLGQSAAEAAEREVALTQSFKSDIMAVEVKLSQSQVQLRKAQASEAGAHRFARTARRVIQARHRQIERQAEEIERAAVAARAEVFRLAADAEKLLKHEQEAEESRNGAQTRFDILLQHEQRALLPRGGMRDTLVLGRARRWRAKAKTYATLVAKVAEASAEIQTAYTRCLMTRGLRVQAEELASSAEPKASELETAAVVYRGETDALQAIIAALPSYADAVLSTDEYGQWVERHDTLTDADRRAIKARQTRFDYKPLISVILPVYNTPLALLGQAIASVEAQLYPHWELCIADDASPNPDVRQALRAFAEADPRIKLLERDSNGHISAASNSALTLAAGEFIALLDHDDILAEQALFEVVACLNHDRHLDVIYSDEDHIDQYGIRSNPNFKPDYNHELMLGQNIICHLGVYRRDLVQSIGGFRLGYEGSQDYDLALRAIDATTSARIHHIPAVLYHWRRNATEASFSDAFIQQCIQSARRALADHLGRRGQAGEVVQHPVVAMWQRIKRPRPHPEPLVSVIVPTKDKPEVLGPCIDGILHRTDYPNIEVIIVDHQSTDPAALCLMEELARDDRVRIMPYEGAFNYSAINNAAVSQARGSILALLNNDVDVINADWLDEMVSLAVLPAIGAVGAKLLYPDDRVQHAGVILGPGGVAGHLFHLFGAEDPGHVGRAVLTAAISAVTGACLVVRKEVFEEVGGFDAVNLPVAFNDVDLCLKIRERGYRNVFTPHARLYHHESLSRGSDQVTERLEPFQREVHFMMGKWEAELLSDPFYNPNLRLEPADFSVAFPPRRKKPWTSTQIEG